MSVQLHAPPTEAEYLGHEKWETGKQITTWSASGPATWCSACRARGRIVAHMGTEDRNFALCRDCIERLTNEFGGAARDEGSPPISNAEGEKNG